MDCSTPGPFLTMKTRSPLRGFRQMAKSVSHYKDISRGEQNAQNPEMSCLHSASRRDRNASPPHKNVIAIRTSDCAKTNLFNSDV